MIEKVYTEEIVNIVNIISDVVDEVKDEYTVYYEHGHPVEIVNTLKEKGMDTAERYEKFPLIALLEDFETSSPKGVIKTTAKLNILFITDTDKNYKAAQRYTNSFDLVLTPIYNSFLKHLKDKKGVHVQHRTIKANTIYHLYWGKKGLYGSEGNIFDDHIDAIALRNLELKIYR